MTAPLTYHASVGQADRCQAYRSRLFTTHDPSRFVWHHILPQACGGKTEPANLASLCDNCHYSVHAALYAMAHQLAVPRLGRAVLQLAAQGFAAAEAAGTEGKIPRQA